MIAISVRRYPTTRRDGWTERALGVGGVGLSAPWRRSVQSATRAASISRGAAEVDPKPVVERRRRANPQPEDSRAPRAAASNGVSPAARRDWDG